MHSVSFFLDKATVPKSTKVYSFGKLIRMKKSEILGG